MATIERASQLTVEVASSGSGTQRISQLTVEVASPTLSAHRISQLVVEVATFYRDPGIYLYINGVRYNYRLGTLRIQQTVNGSGTLSFEIDSLDGSFRVAIDSIVQVDEVTATDAYRLFGGKTIANPQGGIDGEYHNPTLANRVSAVSFNQLAQRRTITVTIPAGSTVYDALLLLMPYVTAYGTTLSVLQAIGPVICTEDLAFIDQRLDTILDDISLRSEYIWEFDPYNVFRMFAPTSRTAIWDVGDNSVDLIGDITAEPTRKNYANRVILTVPAYTDPAHTDIFNGDGVTNLFTLPFTTSIARMRGYVDYDNGGGVVSETLGLTTDSPLASWSFDAVANTITRSDGVPVTGVGNIVVTYDGTYSGRFVGNNTPAQTILTTGDNLWEVKIQPRSPTEIPVGSEQAWVDAKVAELSATRNVVAYQTYKRGLNAGEVQGITNTKRALTGSHLITDILITEQGLKDKALLKQVKLLGGAIYPGGRRTWYSLIRG